MKSEIVKESFTNDINQTINPGEEIIYLGSSWKSTKIKQGIFKGVRYGNVIEYYFEKDKNDEFIKEQYQHWDGSIRFRNKQTYRIKQEVVSVVVSGNQGKTMEWKNGEYVSSTKDVYKITSLPLKRVYKNDTPLSAILNKSF